MTLKLLWRKWWFHAGLALTLPAALGVFAWARLTPGAPRDLRSVDYLRDQLEDRFGKNLGREFRELAPRSEPPSTPYVRRPDEMNNRITTIGSWGDASLTEDFLDEVEESMSEWLEEWLTLANEGVALPDLDGLKGTEPVLDLGTVNWITVRNTARALLAIAMSDAGDGRIPDGINGMERIDRFGQPVRANFVVGAMMSTALRSMSVSGMDTLLNYEMSNEELERGLELLERMNGNPARIPQELQTLEAMTPLLAWHLYDRRTVTFYGPLAGIASTMQGMLDARDYSANPDRIVRLADLGGINPEDPSFTPEPLVLPWTRLMVVADEIEAIARADQELMAAADIPADVFESRNPEEYVFHSFYGNWVAVGSRAFLVCRQRNTRSELTELAWAVRRHRQATGDWPQSLTDLPEKYHPSNKEWDPENPSDPEGAESYPVRRIVRVRTNDQSFADILKEELDENSTALGQTLDRMPGNDPTRVRWRIRYKVPAGQSPALFELAVKADALRKRMGEDRFQAVFTLEDKDSDGIARSREITLQEAHDMGLAGGRDRFDVGGPVHVVMEMDFPSEMIAVVAPYDGEEELLPAGVLPTRKVLENMYSPSFISWPGGFFGAWGHDQLDGETPAPDEDVSLAAGNSTADLLRSTDR